MARDIEFCKASGAKGVVIGALTREGDLDVEAMEVLLRHARPLA
jgi:copper homeostasis protein CutC